MKKQYGQMGLQLGKESNHYYSFNELLQKGVRVSDVLKATFNYRKENLLYAIRFKEKHKDTLLKNIKGEICVNYSVNIEDISFFYNQGLFVDIKFSSPPNQELLECLPEISCFVTEKYEKFLDDYSFIEFEQEVYAQGYTFDDLVFTENLDVFEKTHELRVSC